MSRHDQHLGATEHDKHGFHGFPALPGFIPSREEEPEDRTVLEPPKVVEKEQT